MKQKTHKRKKTESPPYVAAAYPQSKEQENKEDKNTPFDENQRNNAERAAKNDMLKTYPLSILGEMLYVTAVQIRKAKLIIPPGLNDGNVEISIKHEAGLLLFKIPPPDRANDVPQKGICSLNGKTASPPDLIPPEILQAIAKRGDYNKAITLSFSTNSPMPPKFIPKNLENNNSSNT